VLLCGKKLRSLYSTHRAIRVDEVSNIRLSLQEEMILPDHKEQCFIYYQMRFGSGGGAAAHIEWLTYVVVEGGRYVN
jgi:hypothetical protein